MPYVVRNTQGKITALASEGVEFLPSNHPDVLAFLFAGSVGESSATLLTADISLIRVIEDIVDTLISKGVLSLHELPEAAREKLSSRGSLRHDHLQSLCLVGNDLLPPI